MTTRDDFGRQRERERIAALARLLDSAFRIPGTRFRFGIEPILGLVPVVGDLVTGGMGVYLILRAVRYRLPRIVIARMVLNTALDATVGAVPLLGDAFDFVYRSNSRNAALFERYAGDPTTDTREHRRFFVGLALVLVGLIVLILWLLTVVLNALLALF